MVWGASKERHLLLWYVEGEVLDRVASGLLYRVRRRRGTCVGWKLCVREGMLRLFVWGGLAGGVDGDDSDDGDGVDGGADGG